jgi:hypothetical protein
MAVNPKIFGAMLATGRMRQSQLIPVIFPFSPVTLWRMVKASKAAVTLTVRNGYLRVVRPSAFAVGRGYPRQGGRITLAMSTKIGLIVGLLGPADFQMLSKAPSKASAIEKPHLVYDRHKTADKKKSPRKAVLGVLTGELYDA